MAVSIPDGVIVIFRVTQFLCTRLVALWFTQPLTEISTKGFTWGKGDRRISLTTLPPLCEDRQIILGASTSWKPRDISNLYRNRFVLTLVYLSTETSLPRAFFTVFLSLCHRCR